MTIVMLAFDYFRNIDGRNVHYLDLKSYNVPRSNIDILIKRP